MHDHSPCTLQWYLGGSWLQVECLHHGRVPHQGTLQGALAKGLGGAVGGATLAQAARQSQAHLQP